MRNLTIAAVVALMLLSVTAWAQIAANQPAGQGGGGTSAMPGMAAMPGMGQMPGMGGMMNCPLCRMMSGMKGGDGMMMMPGQKYLMHAQMLGLSAAQIRKIRDIQLDLAREQIGRLSSIGMDVVDVAKAMNQDNPNMQMIDNRVRNVAKMAGEAVIASIHASTAAKNVLTPEQQRKAMMIMKMPGMRQGMAHPMMGGMMGRPNNPPAPPPPPGPGQQ